MKVNSSNISKGMQGLESAKTKKADMEATVDRVDSTNSDKASDASKVELSEDAKRMAMAKEIASDNDVDEAKVAHLQKLIDEGQYSVDAEAVADRLVDAHLAMTD